MARILIANDDKDFLEVCQDVLAGAGHVTRAVVSGALALEVARAWCPDLVLLDWKMPDMDGSAAIRAMRADPQLTSLLLLMMSGSENGAQTAAEAGADGFLPKPFTADELIVGVDRVLAMWPAQPGLP